MTPDPVDALLGAFRRYRLRPTPVAAERMAERGTRECRRKQDDRAERRLPHGTDIGAWERRECARFAWYETAIGRIVADEARYAGWRPGGEDWLRLAIAMGIAHGEPGFEFTFPRPNRAAESRFARDNVFAAVRQEFPDLSGEAAAKIAAARLAKKVADGHYGEPATIKSCSAGTIEVEYSKRVAAQRRVEFAAGRVLPGELPPTLRGVLDFRRHFDGLFHAAARMTAWSTPWQVNTLLENSPKQKSPI